MGEELNGLKQMKDGFRKREIIGFGLGLFLFGITTYAMYLSIKSNKLSIRKLKDEGYQ